MSSFLAILLLTGREDKMRSLPQDSPVKRLNEVVIDDALEVMDVKSMIG